MLASQLLNGSISLANGFVVVTGGFTENQNPLLAIMFGTGSDEEDNPQESGKFHNGNRAVHLKFLKLMIKECKSYNVYAV
jgi:hypothetical protein